MPYKTIDEQLPVQVETGEGPDLARITNFGAYKGKLLDLRSYLADSAYYEANFPAPILEALGYGGFPDALTVTGPYVNKTLFDQAAIAVPGEGTTGKNGLISPIRLPTPPACNMQSLLIALGTVLLARQ